MGLLLGDIAFTAFEVPSAVTFGGAQSLAVHRLPGGVRIIDALGADDADISWKGVLTGANATYRARGMDALRISGQPIDLSWDEFCYTVVIRNLNLCYHNSWWIPYKISCLISSDPGVQGIMPTASVASVVLSDLMMAGGLTNVSLAVDAVEAAGNSGMGTPPYAAANMSLELTSTAISNAIQVSEAALSSDNFLGAVEAAGELATAVAARGYVSRAIVNYSQASS